MAQIHDPLSNSHVEHGFILQNVTFDGFNTVFYHNLDA